MSGPDRIFAWPWEVNPNMGQWTADQQIIGEGAEYVRIDKIAALPEVQAMIVGAFEVAATAWFPGTAGMCQLKPENQAVIRALTPADAAAVRDALLAAEREACARIAEDAASMRCGKCGHPKNNHPYRHPFVGVAVDVAATIRRRGDST